MSRAPFRTRNALLLAKVETTPGQDAAPTPTQNAILCEDPQVTYDLNVVRTNEVTGSLDVGADIPAGGRIGFRTAVFLKGSGTAGVAPEYSPLLRASALAEAVQSAAVTGTAQAGGANTITLAAGASATDHAYVGMPITITAGAGAGQTRLIVAYTGATRVATVDRPWGTQPDNTSQYSIPANVQYRPSASAGTTATIYRYQHHQDGNNSLLQRLLGAICNATFELRVGDVPRARIEGRAQLLDPQDVARPAAPVYQPTQPAAWIDAPTVLGGVEVAASQLTINLGNEIDNLPDPNEAYGYSMAFIASRRIGGELLVPKRTVAAFNLLSSWRDGTVAALSSYWGSVAGNRVAIVVPRARFSEFVEVDERGVSYWRASFRASPDSPVPFALTVY